MVGWLTSYLKFVASKPYLEFKPQNFVYFASEEADIVDAHIELSRPNDLDPIKTKGFQDLGPLKTSKQLQKFHGTSYMCTFIPPLTELLNPFHNLLNKNVPFR